MQRRIALALSLAFTTIITFSIVVVGAQAGFFSEHRTAKATAVPAGAAAAGDTAATMAAPPSTVQDPLVVTDYVYVDQTAVPVGVRAASARPATPVPPVPTAASKSKASSSADVQPGENSSPKEPTQVPPSQAPNATEPLASPTSQAPEATSTSVPAPSSTSKPAATATSAPAQSTPTPGTGQPGEIEFVGTATAINGNIVTFLHGGTSTAIKVTAHLSSLSLGTRAQVHAMLSGGVYVATEVEVDD